MTDKAWISGEGTPPQPRPVRCGEAPLPITPYKDTGYEDLSSAGRCL
jgi:hypothetical protein